ncbi:carbohydrate ABC transporter permease [Amycolatopsis aidingensis]|uniref:carbohydrate ABC transporter permease n=1 Tax=Amycolatopsis aidingensis TaxID=2842453 RepID=UPI001C0B537B|nr:carbohydrate ABC transporter permease [Amycolatopsis aidingensis]
MSSVLTRSTRGTGRAVPEGPPAPGTKLGRPGSRREAILRWTLMLVAVSVVLGPLLWQLSTALKGAGESTSGFLGSLVPSDPTLQNFVTAFTEIPLARYLLNSAAIAAIGVTVNLVIATLTGYALARIPFRGRAVYMAVLLATATLPFEVILVSTLLVTRNLGLQDTLLGVVLPQGVAITSLFVMRQAFRGIPNELEEAATVDGAGPFRMFLRVMLPNVKGSLAVVTVLGFLDSWDQFIWPLVILSDPDKYPVSVGVQYLSGAFSADQRVISAAALVVILPPLLVYMFTQRHVFKGLAGGALKG